jgi:hypothetical protein
MGQTLRGSASQSRQSLRSKKRRRTSTCSHEPKSVGRLRPGAGLRRRWAVGWASDEVGSWSCPMGRWNPHHDAGATGVSVADGEGSLECAADADPDDRRNGRGGDRRQRVRLAAVCSVVAFLASSSGDGLSSFLVAPWPSSGGRSDRSKSALPTASE